MAEADDLCLMTAKQLASGLMRAYCLAHRISRVDQLDFQIPVAKLHCHDGSTVEIVWNDVQAIQKFNELKGDHLDVPMVATEGYNKHGHTSPFDGGWIPGSGPHDHRDNNNGGFAFAVYHPGTSLPQQKWAI